MDQFTQPGYLGAVDESGTIDAAVMEQQAKEQSAPAPEAVREVMIRVPASLPDNTVFNAWQIGMGTLQRIEQGLMVVAFPTIGQGPDGQPCNMIGRAEVLLARKEDVELILGLCRVITETNMGMAEAAQKNPADMLAATIRGKQVKEEAGRQARQVAQGQTPIVMAHDAGKQLRRSPK